MLSSIYTVFHVKETLSYPASRDPWSCPRGIEIKPITPESVLFVGEVPIIQFEMPGSEDLADRVVETLKSHHVDVMQNHGVVAVGRSIIEALNRLEVVKSTAHVMTVAHIWGGTPPLSPDQLEKLKHLATA